MVPWWTLIIVGVAAAVGAFFISRWWFQRQLKKNPPINEKMIRTLYAQMGRKPSEAEIRRIMNSIEKQK